MSNDKFNNEEKDVNMTTCANTEEHGNQLIQL